MACGACVVARVPATMGEPAALSVSAPCWVAKEADVPTLAPDEIVCAAWVMASEAAPVVLAPAEIASPV